MFISPRFNVLMKNTLSTFIKESRPDSSFPVGRSESNDKDIALYRKN